MIECSQRNVETTGPEVLDRCEVHGIQRTHGQRERLQSSLQDLGRELEQGHLREKLASRFAMRLRQRSSVETNPHLILEQSARDYLLPPDLGRWSPVLREELGERHRSVKVDQRSALSSASSSSRVSRRATGRAAWRGWPGG